MNFKDYCNIFEFGDVTAIKTDEVELKTTNRGYEYYFTINDNTYLVYFYNTTISIPVDKNTRQVFDPAARDSWKIEKEHIELADRSKCYDVGLKLGQDYNLTKLGIPFTVYSHLFKAFKKFLEVAKPIAMEYFGYERSMDLLYQKFYEKFLSKQFMKIGDRIYLKRRAYYQYNPEMKQLIKNYMAIHNPREIERLADIRATKIDDRKGFLIQQQKERQQELERQRAVELTRRLAADAERRNPNNNPYIQRTLF